MAGVKAYALFHLNMAFSSIEEEERGQVIRRCYWPLLELAREHGVPLGIEATGYSLEAIAAIDPGWIAAFKDLLAAGKCELIGAGYAQVIGPLVPAHVNAANMRLGTAVYRRLLDVAPALALVNEQSYSAGLLAHYIEAGYRAIVMEWDNPALGHPDWPADLRNAPQWVAGLDGARLPVIWNQTIAFQKFQRTAHGELTPEDYVAFIDDQIGRGRRALCLYGSDAEVFDYRPGRFASEAPLAGGGEWARIAQLFEALRARPEIELVLPGAALALLDEAGPALSLEAPRTPIPTKKQNKYNPLRWAVTGRDDLAINTRCGRLADDLARRGGDDDDWRELVYLWSSDFRTHITARRWEAYLRRLADFEDQRGVAPPAPAIARPRLPSRRRPDPEARFISWQTDHLGLRLNLARGLAIERIWKPDAPRGWLAGTLEHGFFDDIALGADFYSGNLVFQEPGAPQVTDLGPVTPDIEEGPAALTISGAIDSALGPITKRVRLMRDAPRIEVAYRLDWPELPQGLLRLGFLTLNPRRFSRRSLVLRSHNGGVGMERFDLSGEDIDHGAAVSYLVSANAALGMTGGVLEIGDARHRFVLEARRDLAAVVGMASCRTSGDDFLCRVYFSASEVDDTARKAGGARRSMTPFSFSYSITLVEEP
jgi:hypothetical protein